MSSARIARALLLTGTALLPLPALAQTAEAPSAPAQAAVPADPLPSPEEDATPDDVVVTGSRIRRPDYEAPNPIVSVNAAALEQSGNTNVTNFLLRVPALTNSQDATRSAGNAQRDGALGGVGLNLLDLRGLGTNRTLVLVNGRRHVASQANSAAVDINVIPIDLIERVDVLTGAASAVYGADGVSGVVNFVMKRDFDGVRARAQMGISQRGDAANRFASVIAGRSFADRRANVTLGLEYNAENPLANDSRDFLRSENRINFVDLNGYDPSVPGSYRVGPVRDLRYASSSPAGIVYIGDQVFRADGVPYTPGTPIGNGYSLGGDDSPVAGYIGDIFPKTERYAVNLLTHFDASDAFKISVEGKFVQSTATTFGSYSGSYPNSYGLDNPFVPAVLRDAAIAAGLTTVDVYRNNFDLPRRGEQDRRRTYRGVIDVTGKITDHAGYDVSYTYGRTDVRATKLNDRLGTNFLDALDGIADGNGGVICADAAARAAGCVPLNSFGYGTADPAAFDYFLSDPVSNSRIEQHVVNASLTGDFGQFFTLPGGPVAFALGTEYRKESSRFRPSQALVDNLFYQFDEYILPAPSRGRFDVWEAFGELNVPLLKDRPFAELLSVGAAGRYSDYSTIGSTKAYSFNGIWSPIRAVTFRGSYGSSVRAPNIGELFQPQTGTSDFFNDPCYLSNRNLGSATRAANCTALIQAAGGNPAGFTAENNPDAAIFIPGTQQGNLDLKPETARTWTAGIVLRPDFVPGLQIAVDWYDIKLRDAINTPSANTVAQLCVDQPNLDNAFCDAIDRRAGSGYISGFRVQPQNVAAFRTAGLELNATYRVDLGPETTLDVRLIGGYLDKLSQIATVGAAVEDNVDQPFRPKYNLTLSPTLNTGPLTIAYNLRWQNGTRRFERINTDNDPTYVDPRYFRFKELWQHDLQLDIRANDRFSFYTGVINLGDQKPDIGFQTNVPISPLGRYLYAGVRVAFDRR